MRIEPPGPEGPICAGLLQQSRHVIEEEVGSFFFSSVLPPLGTAEAIHRIQREPPPL